MNGNTIDYSSFRSSPVYKSLQIQIVTFSWILVRACSSWAFRFSILSSPSFSPLLSAVATRWALCYLLFSIAYPIIASQWCRKTSSSQWRNLSNRSIISFLLRPKDCISPDSKDFSTLSSSFSTSSKKTISSTSWEVNCVSWWFVSWSIPEWTPC